MRDESYGESQRPGAETDAVYSNFDHELERGVVAELAQRPGEVFAQHAAWNFCGYVWADPAGGWCDEVWRFNNPVELVRADSADAVVQAVNEKYGSR